MAFSPQQLIWSSYGFGFAARLRDMRLARGLSQQMLADIAGMSRNAVSNLERNHNNASSMADPSLSTVYKLALALEVPPAALLPSAGRPLDTVYVEHPEDAAPFPPEYIQMRRAEARGIG